MYAKQRDKIPGEILGKFPEIFVDICSALNVHSAYSRGIFVVRIVNANYEVAGVSVFQSLDHHHQVSSKCGEGYDFIICPTYVTL